MPERRKKPRVHKRRGPRYWIVAITTMGVLVAYCPGKGHNVVLGKTSRTDETIVNTQQRLLQFDIPAGTLEAALNKFQNTAEIRVVIPNDAMRSLSSPDRKSTRLNSSHSQISYAVFCLKKKIKQ